MKIRERDLEVLSELCNLPTAPYCEQHVIAWLLAWAQDEGRKGRIRAKRDPAGNVYLHYRHGSVKGPPLVIEAHMDHPGFLATGTMRDGRIKAQFRGGVKPSNFKEATAAFWVNEPAAVGSIAPVLAKGHWVPVRVVEVEPQKKKRPWLEVVLEAPPAGERVVKGSLGMWALPEARVDGEIFAARVCDDLGGVAGIVRMLEELIAQDVEGHVIGLCTRAEEVGFAGVLAAVSNGWVPKKARVIGLETSKGSAAAPQGGGPVVRVGDKTGIFSPGLTHFVAQCAGFISDDDAGFKWQRKLMDGGTCNTTPFTAWGYDAAALCVALGNYHNQTVEGEVGWGTGGKAGPGIGSETIHLGDFGGMVRILVEAAKRIGKYKTGFGAVREQLTKLHEEQREMLFGTSDQGRD